MLSAVFFIVVTPLLYLLLFAFYSIKCHNSVCHSIFWPEPWWEYPNLWVPVWLRTCWWCIWQLQEVLAKCVFIWFLSVSALLHCPSSVVDTGPSPATLSCTRSRPKQLAWSRRVLLWSSEWYFSLLITLFPLKSYFYFRYVFQCFCRFSCSLCYELCLELTEPLFYFPLQTSSVLAF